MPLTAAQTAEPSVFQVPAIPPPPPPTVARPTPPSGTSSVNVSSPVAQSAVAPEDKREEEVAISQVHHMSAYLSQERHTSPVALRTYAPSGLRVPPALPIVVLVAGAIAACGIRRGRPDPRRAYVRLADERPPHSPSQDPTRSQR